MMDNYILDWGARALLSSATIPRAHLMKIITPPPAETSQTECSRWGSPAQTRQTTFAGRAVTRRGPTAQPAQTKPTSDVQNLINAFIPVWNVIVILNVKWEKMRIWSNVKKYIGRMMAFQTTKYPGMPRSDARGNHILTWKHLRVRAIESLSVLKMKMN